MAVDTPATQVNASANVTWTTKGQAKREALLSEAETLVLTYGLDALSYRALAKAAGVPLGSTTYYFTDLRELHVLVVQRILHGWIEGIENIGRHHAPSNAAELIAVLDKALLPQGQNYQRVYEFLISLGRVPELTAVCAQTRERMDAAVQMLIRSAKLRLSAALVIAVADGAMLAALSEGRHPARLVRVRLKELVSLVDK